MAEGTQYGMAAGNPPAQTSDDFGVHLRQVSSPPEAPRTPAILDAVEALASAIDRAHAGQEATENAIAKILRPSESGTAIGSDSLGTEKNSELAARLYGLVAALESLHRRQTDTLNRIEI